MNEEVKEISDNYMKPKIKPETPEESEELEEYEESTE